MWRNNVYNLWCFVAFYNILLPNQFFLQFTLFCREISFGTIYALLRGEKFSQKVCLSRKNDKYQVCACVDNFSWLSRSHKLTQASCTISKARSLGSGALIMAHELGHNMGADHDGEGVNEDCDGAHQHQHGEDRGLAQCT